MTAKLSINFKNVIFLAYLYKIICNNPCILFYHPKCRQAHGCFIKNRKFVFISCRKKLHISEEGTFYEEN